MHDACECNRNGGLGGWEDVIESIGQTATSVIREIRAPGLYPTAPRFPAGGYEEPIQPVITPTSSYLPLVAVGLVALFLLRR